MRHSISGLMVFLLVFALFSYSHGAEHFGVPVYQGARLDANETDFMRKNAGADGHFYRTGDKVEKVLAFYTKQPGLTCLGSDKNGGRFIKEEDGQTIYVIVESPWQPSKGGAVSRDTKIYIVRE